MSFLHLKLQEDTDEVWFWRDFFGRRSLLIAELGEGFIVSSVGDELHNWEEVPSSGIFCLKNGSMKCYPYSRNGKEICFDAYSFKLFKSMTISYDGK